MMTAFVIAQEETPTPPKKSRSFEKDVHVYFTKTAYDNYTGDQLKQRVLNTLNEAKYETSGIGSKGFEEGFTYETSFVKVVLQNAVPGEKDKELIAKANV